MFHVQFAIMTLPLHKGPFILKLINNSSRENKENHNCDRGLDM